MQGPSVPQQLYRKLNREYNELLEKNQNDLIKIKMRQKQLNDKIASIQQENASLRQELATLKANTGKQGNIVKSIQQGSEFQSKIKDLSRVNQNLMQQIEALKKTIAALLLGEKNHQKREEKSKQQILNLHQELDRANIQISNLKNNHEEHKRHVEDKIICLLSEKAQQLQKQLSEKEIESSKAIKQLEEENLSLSQQKAQVQQKYLHMQWQLQQGQKELLRLQQQKKEIQDQPCANCKDLQQKVELHQQMLKSVKMMLKFKQMELDKFKK